MALLENKYGGLYWTISQKIGLDPILHDNEDCVQDMRILAYKVLLQFKVKKYPELSVEEIIETSHFDKYLKTALWNYKNTSGSKITKRKNKLKPHSIDTTRKPTDEHGGPECIDGYLFQHGRYYSSSALNIEDLTEKMGPIARDAIKDLFFNINEDVSLGNAVKRTLEKHNVDPFKKADMVYGVQEEVKRAIGKKK